MLDIWEQNDPKTIAQKMERYYIDGSVGQEERLRLLDEFRTGSNAKCQTLFLSRVGDNAIDLPDANVIVQIAAHFASRRQEAQRLGRILRPKKRKPRSIEQDPDKISGHFLLINRFQHL